MTNEKCSNCEGKLKPSEKVQMLVVYSWDRYWALVTLYKCVDCGMSHIVDSP